MWTVIALKRFWEMKRRRAETQVTKVFFLVLVIHLGIPLIPRELVLLRGPSGSCLSTPFALLRVALILVGTFAMHLTKTMQLTISLLGP